jgi:hypothetical protein
MRIGPDTQHEVDVVRPQLLRNLDAAWEERGDRSLAAFFIVEGVPERAESVQVPSNWEALTDATIKPNVLAESLPHHDRSTQRRIAACYLGATTGKESVRSSRSTTRTPPDTIIADL